jgi:hypothetical protein
MTFPILSGVSPSTGVLTVDHMTRAWEVLSSMEERPITPLIVHPAVKDRYDKWYSRDAWYRYWREWRAFRTLCERGMLA